MQSEAITVIWVQSLGKIGKIFIPSVLGNINFLILLFMRAWLGI